MTERSDRPMVFEGMLILIIIMLTFVLFCMIASDRPGTMEKWGYAGNKTPEYMAVGDDAVLYAFYNNTVLAIDRRGNEKWWLKFPETTRVCCDIWTPGYIDISDKKYPSVPFANDCQPVYDIEDGNLYLYIQPSNYTCKAAYMRGSSSKSNRPPVNANKVIVAVSPDGELLWNVTLTGPVGECDDTAVDAAGDRIYVFHQYNETVLDLSGNVLFSIPDVSDPASIGADGMIYASKSRPYQAYVGKQLSYITADFRVPSGVIEAYYPNGTLCWQHSTDMDLVRPGDSMPVYRNGMLYLPARNGIAALSVNGSLLWSRTYNETNLNLLDIMPFDHDGNVYLTCAYGGNKLYHVIGMDGTEATQKMAGPGFSWSAGSENGIAYIVNFTGLEAGNLTLFTLDRMIVTARDIRNGTELWASVLPVVNTTAIIFDDRNVYDFFNRDFADYIVSSNFWNVTYDLPFMPMSEANITIKSVVKDGRLYQGKGIIYISTYRYNYEDPVMFNRSRLVYSSCIYALDKNGSLLWYKPMDSLVGPIYVQGNTLYYSTDDGRISAADVNVAAGITIIAAAYVFFKFFLVGVVSRLKERLPKNPNRSKIFEFIADNPGATLNEISRDLKMNVGTVRYHLWMLETNHRIVSHQADRKYVRYFPNSHTYSDEEQLIVSIVRRDVMRRILRLLIEKPGLTNRELARIAGMHESAASRYLGELLDKGIVERELTYNRHTYRIKEEYASMIRLTITGMKKPQVKIR